MKITMKSKVLKYLNETATDKNGKTYREFFRDMLKKYNVKSPAELTKEQKVEFFNEIELTWKNENTRGSNIS